MSPEAQKQFEEFPPEVQASIRAAAAKLAENPYAGTPIGRFLFVPPILRPILSLGAIFLLPFVFLLSVLYHALARKVERIYCNALHAARKRIGRIMGCAYYRR